jgi:hypothetical protein
MCFYTIKPSNCSNQEPFSLNNLLFSIDLKIYYALPRIRKFKFLEKKKKDQEMGFY